ncbi:MAG: polysaccharide deacetylase family protein [Chthoniobacteraceae bacterium]
MREPRQKFYSSLDGFGEYFKSGTGALLYHKVGVRPAGTIFKALYVSPELFEKQMRELKRAGVAGVGMGRGLVRVGKGWIALVITFDDGFENAFRNSLKPLSENGFQATQYIVTGMLGGRNEWDIARGEVPERLMDAAQVREWIAAGHEIGAHGMTHANLCEIPAAEAREEIVASKKKLEDTFGVPIEHFCYPYGKWNERVRDLVAEAGYLTACTTDRGINTPDTPRLELKRWLARPPGVRPKEVLARFLDKVFTFRPDH